MDKKAKELNDWLFTCAVGIVKIHQLMSGPPVCPEVDPDKEREDARDIEAEQKAARGEED